MVREKQSRSAPASPTQHTSPHRCPDGSRSTLLPRVSRKATKDTVSDDPVHTSATTIQGASLASDRGGEPDPEETYTDPAPGQPRGAPSARGAPEWERLTHSTAVCRAAPSDIQAWRRKPRR